MFFSSKVTLGRLVLLARIRFYVGPPHYRGGGLTDGFLACCTPTGEQATAITIKDPLLFSRSLLIAVRAAFGASKPKGENFFSQNHHEAANLQGRKNMPLRLHL